MTNDRQLEAMARAIADELQLNNPTDAEAYGYSNGNRLMRFSGDLPVGLIAQVALAAYEANAWQDISEAPTLMGFPIKVSNDVPVTEIWFLSDTNVVGKITNLKPPTKEGE